MGKSVELWFDVGIKRYTTQLLKRFTMQWLWFDVGIKRYTTHFWLNRYTIRCGLM